MNRWTIVLVFLIAAACGQPPGAQPPTEAASAPAAEPAPKSEAIARADALLEDFRRREAAQAKYDRENPPPRFVPIPKTLVDAARASAASTASDTSASNASAGSPPAPGAPAEPAAPARNEMWWKRQMESLQTALDQELVKLAAMEKANLKYGYNDAQAQYKKQAAAVANARQAIERLRDEARRAGVPPGWLRP